MNWDAIDAAAEFLSSIGVLVTLIYIAVQVRDARSTNLINESAQITDNIAGRVLGNPQLLEVLSKVGEKTGQLNPPVREAMAQWNLTRQEAELWSRYWGSVWRGFQARHTAGILDDRTLSIFLDSPQVKTYVRSTKHTYTEDFLARLEKVCPKLFGDDA